MLLPIRRSVDETKFQSAPGLEAGRCQLAEQAIQLAESFQSAPGLEAGRCLAESRPVAQRIAFVSIRARP